VNVANSVKEQLSFLIDLQTLDSRIGQLRDRKLGVPQAIEEIKQRLETVKAGWAAVKNEAETVQKNRRDKERDLETQEEKIGKLKSRTSEIKTNKEYQAHLSEIDSSKKTKDQIEEALLVLMERGDSLKARLSEQEALLAQAEKQHQQDCQKLSEEAVQIEEDLKRLELQRKDFEDKIEKSLLQNYSRLKEVRKDLAVVPIKDGTCLGCRLQLPPQLIAEVRKKEKIQTCSNCHRILYWPAPIAPSEKTAKVAG
jgi:predicted  nucleic acid-binding Zn-ribbon protein